MKRFLILYYFLFSLAAQAVQPSGVPSFHLGCFGANSCAISESPSNPAGWFTLSLGGSITTNQFRAFVKNGGSQYQVPAGGITCFHMNYTGNTGSNRFQLASSTAADGLTPASLTASGVKYESGAATSFGHIQTTGQVEYEYAMIYSFDASSYPYATVDSTSTWGIVLTCKPN